MTNNIHSNTLTKTLIATLTILTISGLGAASASSLSLDSDSQEVQPGDSISGEFDTNSTDTDVQVALDVDQDGTFDNSTDTTVTVSSGDISSDTDVSFSSLSVPSEAAEGTADVVAIQQSSSLDDTDDISSPDSSTTTEIDDTDPTTSLTVDDKQVQSDGTVQVSYTVNDENTVDSASLTLEDSGSDTLSKSKSDLTIGSGTNTADFDLTNLDSSSAATGEFTVSLDATDKAGNSPDTVSDTGTVDDSNPSASVDSQSNDVEAEISELSGTTSDEQTSVSSVEVQIQRSSDGDYYTGSEWEQSSTSVSTENIDSSGETVTWTLDLTSDGNSKIEGHDTYTVKAKATDAAGNTPESFSGDGQTYYTSIDDAVSAASGDSPTVTVPAGTYDESVTVGTANLTLRAAEGENPEIGQMDINADGVTLDGFSVKADDVYGVLVDANGVEIRDNTFDSQGSEIDGLRLSGGTSDPVIAENTFKDASNSAKGVVTYGSEGSIENVEVDSNTFENVPFGVYVAQTGGTSSNWNIEGNSFSEIGTSAVTFADQLGSGLDLNTFTVTENKFEDGSTYAVALSSQGEPDYSGKLDAKGNYWGSSSPDFDAMVLENSGSINYAPWYATSDLTEDVEVIDSDDNVRAYSGTIQAAEDAANSEDTVLVGSGTYDPVTVDTSDLTIESVDGVTPSIEGGTGDSKTVDITVEGVTVDGFEVRNVLSSSGGDNVVYVDHGSSGETNLSNNEFVADAGNYSDESGETEFSVETKSTLVAEGNVFREVNTDESTLTHGIRGTDSNAADSVIKDNRFGPEPSETSSRSEGVEAMTTGVQMAGADNVEISGNEFVDIWGGSVIVSGDVQDFNASNNDFMYSNGGVQFIADSDSFSGSLTVKENSFVELGDEDLSTSGGVFVGTSFGSPSGDPLSSDNVVDATNNYWGDASGPSGDGSGDGASVTTGVDFRPWYLSEESVGQGTYDVTFSLTDSNGEFKAFSPHQAYQNMEVVTGDNDQVLSYRSADWQPVDPSTGTAADAFFVKNVDAVGYDEADSGQVSVTLPEDSWTFVGSYPNNGNQKVSDVFSMVSGSDEVQTVHHPGINLGLVDRNDVDAATQTNNVASDTNFGFSSASDSQTSVLDGYWMRSSTETTLSTTPQPPVAE